MDAEPPFDLALAEREAGRAGRRHRAGRQRDAHRAERGRGFAGVPRDLGERQAGRRRRAGDAMHEHRAGQAAPAGMFATRGERDVVGDDHRLDVDPFRARDLGGEPEIEPVAGVVLDDQQHAGRAAHGADRVEHRVDRRRREHFARHRRAQHAAADITGMRGFVAGAAARHERDLAARGGLGRVGAHHDRAVREQRQVGMQCDESVQQVGHHAFDIVDQLLHSAGSPGAWLPVVSSMSRRTHRVRPS